MKLAHPLPSGRQTDRYGNRGYVPGVGNLGFHHGNDWVAPSGTPIRAAASGTVWSNYFDKLGGWMVILKHSWGYTSYQHMRAKAKLAIGQFVSTGQLVGNVGTSGASTGPHLHFEVWIGGTPYGTGKSVDPLKYIATPTPKPTPKPTPTPAMAQEYWEEPMKAIYYMNGKTYQVAIFHPVSGFWSRYSTTDQKYNNQIAATLGTGNFTQVTKSHFEAMEKDLAAVRQNK